MIPSKPTPLRVVIQHPVELSDEAIKALFQQLLVPIVPKAFLRSDIRTNQESLVTNCFPTLKCANHPIFAPKEAKWGLTFFTVYHSQLLPIADLVLFLDYDSYGTMALSWLKRMSFREWSEHLLTETVGSVLIGSAVGKGAELIEPKNNELANDWAREKANSRALFLKFNDSPGGVAYEIFQGYESQLDKERRNTIKPIE